MHALPPVGAVRVVDGQPSSADLETILLLVDLLEHMGLAGLTVKLNSVGDTDLSASIQARVQELLAPRRAELYPIARQREEPAAGLRLQGAVLPAIVNGLPPMLRSL